MIGETADWSGFSLDFSVAVRRAESAASDARRSFGLHYPAFDTICADFRLSAEVRVEIGVVDVNPEDGNPVELRP